MKSKLSITLDPVLVDFVDALPGSSRSAKIEEVLKRYKIVIEETKLVRALAEATELDDERLEREAWVRTMDRIGCERPRWSGDAGFPTADQPTHERHQHG